MAELIERFETLRSWLANVTMTEEMHKQRFLFLVSSFG